MRTADDVEISPGGKYWTPTEDEMSTVNVTAVKLHPPKRDDLFPDMHTVEVVSEDTGKRWHEFPGEMFSTRESCISDIIARGERRRESMYNDLERLEMGIHALKNGEDRCRS